MKTKNYKLLYQQDEWIIKIMLGVIFVLEMAYLCEVFGI